MLSRNFQYCSQPINVILQTLQSETFQQPSKNEQEYVKQYDNKIITEKLTKLLTT
jgi:hypothetical protein